MYNQRVNLNHLPLEPYQYPNNLDAAINLIKDAVSGEKEDENFYNYLISIAPSNEAKEIIETIKNDEMKHNQLFRLIYSQLTKKKLPPSINETFNKPSNFCEGIKLALKGELSAVRRYRQILFAMQDRIHINMLTEIITDEIRHSSLYNFLIKMYC